MRHRGAATGSARRVPFSRLQDGARVRLHFDVEADAAISPAAPARRAAYGRAANGGVEFIVTGNLLCERQAVLVIPLYGL
jgi:hypothetical protein